MDEICLVTNIRDEKLIRAFGLRLRKIRRSLDLSQEDLADRANIQANQISRIENGRSNPTLSTIVALSKALGIEAGELIPSGNESSTGSSEEA